MSFSNRIESAAVLMRQSTPALVSPADVPQPQVRPGPVTDDTVASAFQLVTFEVGGNKGAVGITGDVGITGVAVCGEPPVQAARSKTEPSTAE